MNDRATLVLIATGQNWPNAISWEYYNSRNRLDEKDAVRIYATKAMAKQAKALLNYAKCGEIHQAHSNSLEEFSRFLSTLPGDRPWIVNMTGGIKPFWLAIPGLLDRPNTSVIYRELTDQKWYRIIRSDPTRFQVVEDEETRELTEQERVTNDDPTALFQLQLCNENLAVSFDKRFKKTPPDQKRIEEILSQDGFSGMDLEELVARALRLFGMTTFRGLKVKEGDKVTLECDVFAMRRARALMIECKLIDDQSAQGFGESPVEVLSKTATAARVLSGLGARPIVIAPNWPSDRFHPELAQSLGVEVWGRAECRTLFQQLCRYAQAEHPKAQEWDARLAEVLGQKEYRARTVFDLRAIAENPWKGEAGNAGLPYAGLLFTVGDVNLYWDGSSTRQLKRVSNRGSKARGGQKELAAAHTRLTNKEPTALVLPGDKILVLVPRELANREATWHKRPPRDLWAYVEDAPGDPSLVKRAKRLLAERLA